MEIMSDGVARTDREIQHALKNPEPVRPRINELLKAESLFEVGDKRCEFTGKKVRLTRRFL